MCEKDILEALTLFSLANMTANSVTEKEILAFVIYRPLATPEAPKVVHRSRRLNCLQGKADGF